MVATILVERIALNIPTRDHQTSAVPCPKMDKVARSQKARS